MIKVTIRAENKRYTIPLPYSMLHIVSSIACSKWLARWINKGTKNITLPTPLVDKKTLQPVIAELKKYKGLTIVDVEDQDGNGVVVRL
jgi:hypothetical protein